MTCARHAPLADDYDTGFAKCSCMQEPSDDDYDHWAFQNLWNDCSNAAYGRGHVCVHCRFEYELAHANKDIDPKVELGGRHE